MDDALQCDDILLSSIVYPSLTTVRQSYRQIAEAAINCICTRLADPEHASVTINFEPELVIRASTAPPGF
jgi:DNA-binding LacI/PurR family transcriptional regulator